jgi:hypothetical protein
MLHLDLPTLPEVRALATTRADACVSIYLPTTPLSQHAPANATELKNLTKVALDQLRTAKFDKRRLARLSELFTAIVEDEGFWRFQAHSLAILATPDSIRTFRLPNRLTATTQVSDRFHLKPLLRAVTFPNAAFVLALSEDAVRLVEVSSDLPARLIKVPGMPKSAAAAVGKATINERSPSGRIQGGEGQKLRLTQYARQVDTALRPVLAGRDTPLIVAATEPLSSLYSAINTYPGLCNEAIKGSPERTKAAELAQAARPILDRLYAGQINQIKSSFENLRSRGLATTDVSDAARAATRGAIRQILVDIDEVVPGTVDEATGAVTFAQKAGAGTYGVIDEIACRALLSGAEVLAVRKDDIPGRNHLAVILRY